MAKRVSIIHFNPLELYPPVMNWLNYAAGADEEADIRVYTLRTELLPPFEPAPGRIRIIRPAVHKEQVFYRRYWNYFKFYLITLLGLITRRPGTILYFETLSALPAIVYKTLFHRNCRLLIHYHEYMDPEEYRQGMLLNRVLHDMEKKVYPGVAWLSHTNEQRLHFFLRDNASLAMPHTHVLPNFPPKSWVIPVPKKMGRPLQLINVGSLGLNAMYVKELSEWVIAQEGKVIWDIYSLRVTRETREYLGGLDTPYIRFMGGCSYFELPGVLARYDAGVVLYRGAGENKNTVYAASNKVFEYLACGLDVWYSKDMVGTNSYDTHGVFPQVIPVDFSRLETFNWEEAIDRKDARFRPSPYFCEEVLEPLWKAMINI